MLKMERIVSLKELGFKKYSSLNDCEQKLSCSSKYSELKQYLVSTIPVQQVPVSTKIEQYLNSLPIDGYCIEMETPQQLDTFKASREDDCNISSVSEPGNINRNFRRKHRGRLSAIKKAIRNIITRCIESPDTVYNMTEMSAPVEIAKYEEFACNTEYTLGVSNNIKDTLTAGESFVSFNKNGVPKAHTSSTYRHKDCGKLNVNISLIKDKLIVHIFRAKDIAETNTFSQSYVTAELTDMSIKGKIKQSSLVKTTADPDYNDELIFKLKRKDYNKRIILSVNTIDQYTSSSNHCGCMSFNVGSIAKKHVFVSGWYNLMDKYLGCAQHLKVSECDLSYNEASSQNSSGYVTSSNNSSFSSYFSDDTQTHCPVETERIGLTLYKKPQQDYGLTLINEYPAMVSKVTSGSPADRFGLQVGDLMVSVDSVPVYDMNSETVGKIIKHYPQYIHLQILRTVSLEESSSQKDSDYY